MPALAELVHELDLAIVAKAPDGMRRLRQAIVAEYPDSEFAAEARYRLGLDALFFGREIDRAMELFDEAGKTRHSAWAPAARTSLALCLMHLGREQKAMFELRKVAFVREPTAHSVTALTLMETFCARGKQAEELARVRKERIGQLERLAAAATTPVGDRAQYLVQLGLAYIDTGDKRRGRTTLEQAKSLGPLALGAENHAQVLMALAQ